MKHLHPRHDDFTRKLLEHEAKLSSALRQEELEGVLERIRDITFVGTSKDLDNFLQLCMLFVTSQFYLKYGKEVYATVTVFNRHRQDPLLHIKPCFYGVGQCQVQDPTIPLIDTAGPIGISGLSFLSGAPLVCGDLPNCKHYIKLSGTSPQSALCVPLMTNLPAAIEKFIPQFNEPRTKHPACVCGRSAEADCAVAPDALTDRVRGVIDRGTYGLINLESGSDIFWPAKCADFFSKTKEPEFWEVVDKMVAVLAQLDNARRPYLVANMISSVNLLSQHNLDPRGAYKALLNEVSKMCNGADATLHLRDLFLDDVKDKARCLRLVVGVGRNFRGFLINERYGLGEGLVGQCVAEKTPLTANEKQIREAMAHGGEGPDGVKFKRLMPATIFNAAMPIFFERMCIGALNIEWDAASLVSVADHNDYFRTLEPFLIRVCAYLSQVIDYFDDLMLPQLRTPPPDEPLTESIDGPHDYFKSHRLLMGYYVRTFLDNAILKGPTIPAEAEVLALQDIVDAAGYHLSGTMNERIQFSVRRWVKNDPPDDDGELKMLVHHGYESEGESVAIKIAEGTVLGRCVKEGWPLFGEVVGTDDDRLLELETLLKRPEMFPDIPDGRYGVRPGNIRFRGAKKRDKTSLYECAAPLIFGTMVFGAIDYEIFILGDIHNRRKDPRRKYEVNYLAILEWARAIAFCLAHVQDRRAGNNELNERQIVNYENFKRLCSQVVANVPMDLNDTFDLTFDYYKDFLPIAQAYLLKPNAGPDSGEDAFFYPPSGFRSTEHREQLREHLRWQWARPTEADEKDRQEEGRKRSDFVPLSDRCELLGGLLVVRPTEVVRIGQPAFTETASRHAVRRLMKLLAGHCANIIKGDKWHKQRAEKEQRNALEDLVQYVLKRTEQFVAAQEDAPSSIVNKFLDNLRVALRPGSVAGESPPFLDDYCWLLYRARPCAITLEIAPILECGSVPTADDQDSRWIFLPKSVENHFVEKVSQGDRAEFIDKIIAARPATADPRDREAENVRYLRKLKDEVLRKSHIEDEDLLRVAREGLAHRVYLLRRGEKSHTVRAALHKKVLPIQDMNMSPYRSPRATRWFFDGCYSLLSIPLLVGGAGTFGGEEPPAAEDRGRDSPAFCIGVLNLIRKRDRANDFQFFKTDEAKSAERLQNMLAGRLNRNLKILCLERKKSQELQKLDFWNELPSVQTMKEEIEKTLRKAARTFIITPFADVPGFDGRRLLPAGSSNWEAPRAIDLTPATKVLPKKDGPNHETNAVIVARESDFDDKSGRRLGEMLLVADERGYRKIALFLSWRINKKTKETLPEAWQFDRGVIEQGPQSEAEKFEDARYALEFAWNWLMDGREEKPLPSLGKSEREAQRIWLVLPRQAGPEWCRPAEGRLPDWEKTLGLVAGMLRRGPTYPGLYLVDDRPI
jgi:hypothetical protein